MDSNIWNDSNIREVIISGGIVVMPTDTIYGIVGNALNRDTVEKIYEVRRRSPEKPCIILISSFEEFKDFNIFMTPDIEREMRSEHDKPTSFILDCDDDNLEYLHRGTKTLAFRIPKDLGLMSLLKNTGPLIAPSANPEGLPPAKDIEEAEKYFGDLVNLYVDGGKIEGEPSRIVRLSKDGSISIIRE